MSIKTNTELIDSENARFYQISLEEAKKRVGVGEVKALLKPKPSSQKEENGQLTIIGGSSLFHGAPLLALTVASRIVDMVFFSGPKDDKDLTYKLKSELYSFIWVPEEEIDYYIAKSDAVLIGPGLMRYHREISNFPALPAGRQFLPLRQDFSGQAISNNKKVKLDKEGLKTKRLSERLLAKFPEKKWIIDAGSLQTIEAKFIPQGAILTPNSREFEILFDLPKTPENVSLMAKKYQCIIVNKGGEATVSDEFKTKTIGMPQPGLTKGGTGDVTAGIIAALACKNDSFLAASAGAFLVKLAAQRLGEKIGNYYNADDLAKALPETIKWCEDF
ncbi:NAD(P)H-hydrate dehydratase [Candidatus Microgenomates bacterium]|nr:NAD(P)H-hydrate dehydratase [Candidatus Microgenomates bacterium]